MEIRRLVPGGFTRRPTTRQLILFAIRAQPAGDWPIARIFESRRCTVGSTRTIKSSSSASQT